MHAVVGTATLHDFERGREFLRDEVVPRVSQAPGFVAAYFVRVAEDRGVSVVVYESEEAARAAADQIPRDQASGATTVESIEVGEVVEHA